MILPPFLRALLAFVAFTTDMGAGRTLTDTRSLDEDGAAIKMELELTTPDASKDSKFIINLRVAPRGPMLTF